MIQPFSKYRLWNIIRILLISCLLLSNASFHVPGKEKEPLSKTQEIVPFESEGEPGLLPGFDPAKIEPIPGPQEDPEQGGKLARPLIPTPEKTIKKPTFVKGVQPGPPSSSPTLRPGALTGKFVYVNPGHGWIYSSGAWRTQRGNNLGMVEDLHNADQVSFFMIHYLRNAGATVIPLHDVGPLTDLFIIDNDDAGFTLSGSWTESAATPFWGDSGDAVHYVFADTNSTETAVARWTPSFTTAGTYPVFVWYLDAGNRSTNARYRIVHKGGISYVHLDQSKVGKGWVWLGNYYFDAGTNGYLELINQSSDLSKIVVADAARFGSGVHAESGYPMYEMDGHEYTLFSNAPTSITDVSDVWCRPRMAAYMNNAAIGDVCYISFHSNASSGSARGAMVLKNATSWDGGPAPYVDQFNSALIHQVEDDLYTLWGLPRRSYQVYTSSYGELTYNNLNAEMTATILEVAFHDNVDDVNLLKTPGFRQDTARATLQGIIDYFVNTHGSANSTYPPDAPDNVSAKVTDSGQATLSWDAPPSGGNGAHPATGYVVYRSTDGIAWDNGVDAGNVLTYNYSDLVAGEVYYFRIAAYNAGGESFPSETVGVRMTGDGSRPKILVVSGFRRYDRDIIADYTDAINGTSRRVWPWLANSFNYVAAHGDAIADAGYYFDSADNKRIIDGSILLGDYTAVDWILGRESTADETFNSTEQTLVTNYLNNEGRILVTSEESGWDLELWGSASASDKDFLNNTLQVQCANNDASNTNLANPVPGSIFEGLAQINFSKDYANGYYDTLYPDAYTGLGTGALNSLSYNDGGQTAAIQYNDDTKRIVVMGFPFEMIHGSESRSQVMEKIMDFLTMSPHPSVREMLDYLLGNGGMPYDYNGDGWFDISDPVKALIEGETLY